MDSDIKKPTRQEVDTSGLDAARDELLSAVGGLVDGIEVDDYMLVAADVDLAGEVDVRRDVWPWHRR